jgi:DNA-binding MarR family transcriptional regulator
MNSSPTAAEPRQLAEVVERFTHWMRTLHRARGVRPGPWADCPLTVPQLRALSLLASSDQGLMSRELAARLGVGPSAITPLIDRLVAHGFVQRREDPEDRRVTRLAASESGLDLLGRMSAGQVDLLQDILVRLTPEQIATVGQAFDFLIEGAHRVLAEKAPAACAVESPTAPAADALKGSPLYA